jgi:hypothetical protein
MHMIQPALGKPLNRQPVPYMLPSTYLGCNTSCDIFASPIGRILTNITSAGYCYHGSIVWASVIILVDVALFCLFPYLWTNLLVLQVLLEIGMAL